MPNMTAIFVIALAAAICWPIGYIVIRPLLSPKNEEQPKEPNA